MPGAVLPGRDADRLEQPLAHQHVVRRHTDGGPQLPDRRLVTQG